MARNKADTTRTTADTPRPVPRVPLDWAAPHGPITGALSATSGCAAVATIGAAAGMPCAWPAAVGIAGAVGHGIAASVYRRMTHTTICTRATSWLLAGGWTSWAIASGPLSWTAAGTLAALGVGVGAMASSAAIHEEAAELEALEADKRALVRELGRERAELAAAWQARIKRVCGIDVDVLGIEAWPNGAGYAPGREASGRPGHVADHRPVFRRARRRRRTRPRVHRGGVGGHPAGRAILDVTTRTVMGQDVYYPDDFSPLSLLTGVPWGFLADSHPVKVFLREACAIVLGPPGSGKSTFLDGVLLRVSRAAPTSSVGHRPEDEQPERAVGAPVDGSHQPQTCLARRRRPGPGRHSGPGSTGSPAPRRGAAAAGRGTGRQPVPSGLLPPGPDGRGGHHRSCRSPRTCRRSKTTTSTKARNWAAVGEPPRRPWRGSSFSPNASWS
ncbi:hypothetical protein ACU686_02830 [Yinghuangia aomiensis]